MITKLRISIFIALSSVTDEMIAIITYFWYIYLSLLHKGYIQVYMCIDS